MQVHWGKPEFLSIEPSNFCNLSCPMCPQGMENKYLVKQFIDFELYKKVIDESYRWLTNVQLYFQGEPFLNPELPELIGYATGKNVYTTISTNGHYLTPEASNRVIDSGLKSLIISIDGTTQEVYGKYRVGGSVKKVREGIENIIHAKKSRGKSYPEVVLQFVLFSFNEHQVSEIKALANELGVDRLQLKTAQIEAVEENSDLLPAKPEYSRYSYSEGKVVLKREKRFYCKRIWNGAVITSYGSIVPCCFDKGGKHKYGNVTEKPVTELFKNSTSRIFRKQAWNDSDNIDICRNCTEGVKNVII